MPLAAHPITPAPIDAPWETQLIPVGAKGLYLRGRADALGPDQLLWMTNLEVDGPVGPLLTRRGLTQIGVAAGAVHTIVRLEDPRLGTFIRFVGHGTSVSTGTVGAYAVVDTGYSGDPVTMLPHRPTLSGEPWMIVADRSRVRQIRRDGVLATLGLTAPTVACAAALATERTVQIAEFDASDATEAATWTGNPGWDDSDPPVASGAPSAIDVADPAGGGVEFIGNPGAAITGYSSFWNHALALDLSKFADGRLATDDDLVHVWLKTSNPMLIQEVRVYLVCGATFDGATLPGLDVINNADAYVVTWTQNDIAAFIQGQETQAAAATAARARRLPDESARRQGIGRVRSRPLREDEDPFAPVITDDRDSWADRRAAVDQARQIAQPTPPGAHQWIEYGVVGAPVRKGDFQRIGSTPGRDWATITGIVVYLKTTSPDTASVGLDMLYLTGGSGPDTSEPGATKLDWRYTHYHLLTGDESNGSPEMTEASFLDALRRGVVVTPTGFGNANVRQRVYQRGGALPDDWSYVGQNAADGGAFTCEETDLALEAAPKLATNRYAAVPTQDAAGGTILNQPVPIIFGPVAGRMLALGDPYRPGHLYVSLVDTPGAWDPTLVQEVCPPSEQLMTGLLYAGQGFVFSREALYAVIPTDTGVATTPTGCRLGTLSRRGAVATLRGMAFINRRGIFVTSGGAPEWLSEGIDSLFTGETITYAPIDWTVTAPLILTAHGLELWFGYQDTDGVRRYMVYHLLYQRWRPVLFDRAQPALGSESQFAGAALLCGDFGNGVISGHTGLTDNGVGIPVHVRPGDWFGGTRGDKELGDLHLDADRGAANWEITLRLNSGAVVNPAQTLNEGVGRLQYIVDPFGTTPQSAYSAAVDITWTATTGRPAIYQMGIATRQLPDAIVRRMTQWDDLGEPTEKYLKGVMVEADTYAADVPITIELDYDGAITAVTGAPFTLNCDGRHRRFFSWPRIKGHLVRLRPGVADTECAPWIPYRLAWIYETEPEQIANWDSIEEDLGDTYYTGLDLVCDTRGAAKTIEVYVDGSLVTNPATGGTTFTVTTSSRRWVHLTFGPGRGHIYRFRATDSNAGLVYSHKWHVEAEPTEQANWTQNFTVADQLTDKWISGVLIESDTFNAPKTVRVEVDGVLQTTLTVTANGRLVQQFSFARVRGRVLRLLPSDTNPGRHYSHQWIFEGQPPYIAIWEPIEENRKDTYYTGLDIECDTSGVAKTVEVFVDQTSLGTFPVTANGRRLVHLTLTPGRGHVYRFRSTDANPGYLYGWAWHTDTEPPEQTNWNQNYTVAESLQDKWLQGVLIECDTFNAVKTVQVQVDGTVHDTLSVQANGRLVRHFSFARVRARVLRLLPTDANPGRFYSAKWLFAEEPPSITRWDTNEEDLGPAYYTGLDIDCDTAGAAKTVEVWIDQALVGTFSVTSSGRRVVPLTFGPGRGYIYRFRATDANAGWLYGWTWRRDPEPPEQTNWNQNYTVAETLQDKWLKGVLIESDTFNAIKTVQVQVDGVVHTTLSVQANGRLVQQFSFARIRARVLRLLPTDANPGRFYSAKWVFDEEPPAFARWDTNEQLLGDSYYTGVDIECDTLGAAKTVEVYIDQVLAHTGTVTRTGRGVVHLPFGSSAASYGHVYRFRATDANVGYLYSWNWRTTPNPAEIANWDQGYDDLGDPGDKYLTGVLLECDTEGAAKTVQVIIDEVIVETLTVASTGRTTQAFHFPSGPHFGRIVRLHPTDANPGRLWAAKWLWEKEPDRTAGFALLNYSDLGDPGDKYLTGLLLEVDTSNAVKTVQVELDGVVVETLSVQTPARRTQNFHFVGGPYRGKIVRLIPTDVNPGKLYAGKWLWTKEPDRTAGFALLNFEDLGAPGEKYVTGVLLECDTSNLAKTVVVEIDGSIVETLTVQANGRHTLPFHFAGGPYRAAKVLRLRPTDTNPGQLWAVQWLWEKEPENTAGFGVLNFTDLGSPGEKYVTGIQIEADTGGLAKTVQVEIDGVVVETLTILITGRRVQEFGFAGGPYRAANVLRLIPTDVNPGKLYGVNWLYAPEPPHTPVFGVLNFEDLNIPGEKYVAGILLECDTANVVKTVEVEIDGVVQETLSVQADGRRALAFHFPSGPYAAAKVLRLHPTDVNPGKMYAVQWLWDPEPVATAGFGVQNWSVENYPGDKRIKGVVLEVDTRNQVKTVLVEGDGGTLATLTVQANGRRVLQFSFAQVQARVIRLRATDINPGKLYSTQWIFDEEPLALTRWETQETDHSLPGWHSVLYGHLTYRSTAVVTLTLTAYNQLGVVLGNVAYTLPSSAGVKRKQFQTFEANQGVLYKYLFTSAADFYLYREESVVVVQPFGAEGPVTVHPFGNDDLDATRGMGRASLAAAAPGGMAS